MQLIFMERKKAERKAFKHESAAWNSPSGTSGHTGFEQEPEVSVDLTLRTVIGIFDEGQAFAHKFSSRFHLLDTSNPPSAPHLPREIVTDDYSEDSMP